MILLPMMQPVVEEVEELSDTDRGGAGFGSTGANGDGSKYPAMP
jgi:dUTPase